MAVHNEVSIIGPGAVGANIGRTMAEYKVAIRQVVARQADHALKDLAQETLTDIRKMSQDVELILITTPDHVIPEIVDALSKGKRGRAVVAHTSGSTPISVLDPLGERTGVLYPLQTFSRGRFVKMNTISMFMEAYDIPTRRVIFDYGSFCARKVEFMTSDQRAMLHLGAVFAANFATYMMACADDLARTARKDFQIYRPLMLEVMQKVKEMRPSEALTGPARRGDTAIMAQHTAMLAHQRPEMEEVYRVVSNAIMARYKSRS